MNKRHYVLIILFAGIAITSCAKQQDGAAKDAKPEGETKPKVQYGKIQEVKLGPLDHTMAQNGQKVFDVTCVGCHKYNERYVGPALGDVTKRRTPEYVMNMILDTETMIEKDDTVKCLMQTYLMKMPNMQVDEKDARAVLEHLREVAEKK